MKFNYLLLILISKAVLASINPNLSVDGVLPFSLENSDENKLYIRSVELSAQSQLDNDFEAYINIAGHQDDDDFEFLLHEAYLMNSNWISKSKVKLGKFLINVGKLNRVHQHDWQFSSAPKMNREFFNLGDSVLNAENAADAGVEYYWSHISDRYYEVVFGITNAYCFGHCHDSGARPRYPMHYIHPSVYFDLGDGKDLHLGFNALRRIDSSNVEVFLNGFEMIYKNQVGKELKTLFQAELFYQKEVNPSVANVEKAGFYLYGQKSINEKWNMGLRLDGFSELSLKFSADNSKRNNFDYAIVPSINYISSENVRWRATYIHEVETKQDSADERERQFLIQFSYYFGGHEGHNH